MSAPVPPNGPKGPMESIECEKCYGLAYKISGADSTTCYGLKRKIRVPKEAEKDLTALEQLPPNTYVFILGISAYNSQMCKSGRPPLLLNGVYISHLSQNDSPRTLPTVDDVFATYEKFCKVIPAQVEQVQKGIKTTVTEMEEFYPELKVAAQKTAKELPGKFADGAKVTLSSFGNVLSDVIDSWKSPPKNAPK